MSQVQNLLTLENAVKFSVLIAFGYNIVTGVDSIKSDILLMKQSNGYEIRSLQYQIDECCSHRKNKNKIVFTQSQAILPNNEINNDEE